MPRARATAAAAPPVGLVYDPGFLAPDEQADLLAHVEALSFREVRMHGVTARRTVVSFGYGYGFDFRSLHPVDEPPEWIHALRRRAAALARLDHDLLRQVLVTRYPPGAGIGWHRDAPAFGERVVGVSLAAACVLRFRRQVGEGFEEYRRTLEPGSGYLMSGPARAVWQHHIAAVKELRYSVTFRTVRDPEKWKARAAAGAYG